MATPKVGQQVVDALFDASIYLDDEDNERHHLDFTPEGERLLATVFEQVVAALTAARAQLAEESHPTEFTATKRQATIRQLEQTLGILAHGPAIANHVKG